MSSGAEPGGTPKHPQTGSPQAQWWTVARRGRPFISLVLAVVVLAATSLIGGGDDGGTTETGTSGFDGPAASVVTGGPDGPGAAVDGPSGDTGGNGPAPCKPGAPAAGRDTSGGARPSGSGAAGGPATARPGSGGTPAGGAGAPAAAPRPGGSGVGTEAALSAPDCDRNTKRIRIPVKFAPSCVVPWAEGRDNGGATAPGVTADTITFAVVPRSIVNTGNQEAIKKEWQDWLSLYDHHFRRWGRKVKVVFVDPPGDPTGDEAMQRSLAVDIANQKPFAAYISSAWKVTEVELAARRIITLEDGAPTHSSAQRFAPFLWGSVLNADEFNIGTTAEYIAKRLTGRKARWAGDEGIRGKTRKFGLVHSEASDKTLIEQQFTRLGLPPPLSVTYPAGSPSEYQENVRTVIAKLKSEGVTTVINGTDFVYTAVLTKESTLQLFTPEWIVTGNGGIDLTLFGRTFDQQQWRHAFGPASLPPVSATGDWRRVLWAWHWGDAREANPRATSGIAGAVSWLLTRGVHLAGPVLTPTTFAEAQYAEPPVGGASCNCVTTAQVSYGKWGGSPGFTDFAGYDDFSDVWWDADTVAREGVTGATGPGAYRLMQNGKRYMPGQWPEGEPKAFDRNNTITEEDVADAPPGDRAPAYRCEGCPSSEGG